MQRKMVLHLNPDQKIVDSLIKTLVKREKKYGKKILSLSSSQELGKKMIKLSVLASIIKKRLKEMDTVIVFYL